MRAHGFGSLRALVLLPAAAAALMHRRLMKVRALDRSINNNVRQYIDAYNLLNNIQARVHNRFKCFTSNNHDARGKLWRRRARASLGLLHFYVYLRSLRTCVYNLYIFIAICI